MGHNPRPCRCGHPESAHTLYIPFAKPACGPCWATLRPGCGSYRKQPREKPLRVPGRWYPSDAQALADALVKGYGPPTVGLQYPLYVRNAAGAAGVITEAHMRRARAQLREDLSRRPAPHFRPATSEAQHLLAELDRLHEARREREARAEREALWLDRLGQRPGADGVAKSYEHVVLGHGESWFPRTRARRQARREPDWRAAMRTGEVPWAFSRAQFWALVAAVVGTVIGFALAVWLR